MWDKIGDGEQWTKRNCDTENEKWSQVEGAPGTYFQFALSSNMQLHYVMKNQIKYQVTILFFNQLLDTFDPLLFLIDNIQKVFLIFV